MGEDFVIARNPDLDSKLPFLLRLPLGAGGLLLKSRETWPRTAKVYCHPADEWPAEPDIVERVGVRQCVRRGAAIDLVLDRGRENRSQFVFTRIRGGREAVFWQTARVAKQVRPVAVPTARSFGLRELSILVDVHERYPWNFAGQQVSTRRQALECGDYAVELDGQVVALVERKSLADLVSTLTTGKLRYVMASLATVAHAALVVEDRYDSVFKLSHVRPAVVADGLAEVAVAYPQVPVVFAGSRSLAQEWSYRFLAAALTHATGEHHSVHRLAALPAAGPLAAAPPTTSEVRAWAAAHGFTVPRGGRLRADVWEAWRRDHPDR